MPTPSRPLGAVPQQQRGIEKRQRLFEAAMKEFARRGVEDARVDDIVAEADVGWGTFFHYFPRKEDVLLAAGAEHQRRVEAAMHRAAADESASVQDVVFAAYRAMAKPSYSQALHIAMIREILASPVRFERMLEPGSAPLYTRIASLLEVGQQRGQIRDDVDASMLARILNSAILVTAARVGIPGAVGLSRDVDVAELIHTTFRVVWAGIEVEAQGRPDLRG
jgi:AcrR family transcriptional regulator